jgi:hypothetical protein
VIRGCSRERVDGRSFQDDRPQRERLGACRRQLRGCARGPDVHAVDAEGTVALACAGELRKASETGGGQVEDQADHARDAIRMGGRVRPAGRARRTVNHVNVLGTTGVAKRGVEGGIVAAVVRDVKRVEILGSR